MQVCIISYVGVISTCARMFVRIYDYFKVCVYQFVFICRYTSICMCVCIYLYLYTCECIYTYVLDLFKT